MACACGLRSYVLSNESALVGKEDQTSGLRGVDGQRNVEIAAANGRIAARRIVASAFWAPQPEFFEVPSDADTVMHRPCGLWPRRRFNRYCEHVMLESMGFNALHSRGSDTVSGSN